jgi:HAD superfamily hydrolase (TIGR01549 family)
MNVEKMHGPLGIIFDFGDTVLNLESFDTLAGNRRLLELASVNPGLTAAEVQAAFDDLRWLERVRDETMLEFNCQTLHRLVYETLGISFPFDYAETEREFWQASVKYVPVPGIFGLLNVLEANGIKTGIISNTIFSSSILAEELAGHRLAHRFSFVISSGDYGFRKPHANIFRVAVKKLALDPGYIWFVGDKPEYDIKGALDYGLFPVWLNWQGEPRVLDGDYLEVKDLHELSEKIQHIISGR